MKNVNSAVLPVLLLVGLFMVRAVLGQIQPERACTIQIVIDPFLFERILSETDQENPEEKQRIARYEAVSLAGRLVSQANSVLSRQFIGNQKYKLLLHDVQILSREKCGDLCEESLDIEQLLNVFSYQSRDPYCLSYLLTFRDFSTDRLGLAFTASPYHGGVCEKFRLQAENVGGYEREVNKSLNTGLITLNRSGRRVSEIIAGITFAHEVGHSFGAGHDPAECAGDREHGTFIMHRSGSLADRRNNMLLSSCSLEAMASLLASLDLRETGSCWRLDTGRGTCGNSIVEVWEECDCGRDVDDCARQCCVPPDDPGGRQACKLVQGAQCSPSEGLCCNSKCEYSPSSEVCAQSGECSEEAYCTGKTSYCPFARSVDDSTLCAGGSLVCKQGKCEGSICPTVGKLSCVAESPGPENACSPHCYSPTSPCSPANISYPAGRECRVGDLFGYCQSGGVCQVGGPAAQQQSLLLGLAIFLAFYAVFVAFSLWIYCRYCRPSKITLLPGKSEHSEQQSEANMIEHQIDS